MSRRVVIGKFPDNAHGMRCSLPGFDALTADADDANALSFNSDWNLLKIHTMGRVSAPTGVQGYFGVSFSKVLFPTLPFIPFVDIRIASGDTFYDDYSHYFVAINGWAQWMSAIDAGMTFDGFQLSRKLVAGDLVYIVYREPPQI